MRRDVEFVSRDFISADRPGKRVFVPKRFACVAEPVLGSGDSSRRVHVFRSPLLSRLAYSGGFFMISADAVALVFAQTDGFHIFVFTIGFCSRSHSRIDGLSAGGFA